jgi:hypothetical protein
MLEITIIDNIITYTSSVSDSIQSGEIFLLEKVDDNFIHLGYSEGEIIGITPTDTIVNGLNFTNSDDFINYYNSL